MSTKTKKLTILGLVLILLLGFTFGLKAFLKPPPGRTNFLVMGVAGANHAGSDLTDSMMLVSIDNSTGKTLILSLPRDIWIDSLRTKLNSVYHYLGTQKTKEIITEITGQEINHALLLDFSVFKEIIDNLGGIVVNVQHSFDDYKYPIAGKENDPCNGDKEYKCRYEHLHFDAGSQMMDGERTLKFVRSRNAEGDEGTDFARNQRQQLVILAIKNKVLSPKFLLSPGKPYGLFRIVMAYVKTDIPQSQYLNLAKIGLRIKTANITSIVLNDGYLINPKPSKLYDNQWVLIPKSGNWEEVKKYISSLLI